MYDILYIINTVTVELQWNYNQTIGFFHWQHTSQI
jgi:hypothetical protein